MCQFILMFLLRDVNETGVFFSSLFRAAMKLIRATYTHIYSIVYMCFPFNGSEIVLIRNKLKW